MPDNRSRLHLTKLNEFAVFLESRGFEILPTKGDYEVLRAQKVSKPPIIWFRREGCDHATTPFGPANDLVNAFLRRPR